MRRVFLLALVLMTGAASAQNVDRAGTWEFGADLTRVHGWSASGLGGSSLDFSSDTGWGISGAYNFTNRLALRVSYSRLSPDYDATYVPEDGGQPETFEHTADVYNLHVKGTLYLLPGPLSPFIEAGLGWSEFDSNVASGPPITGCWWDPWWGRRCAPFYRTYGAREVSYTGTVGVRWDVSSSLMLRGEYGMIFLEGNGLRDKEKPNMFGLSVGWRF